MLKIADKIHQFFHGVMMCNLFCIFPKNSPGGNKKANAD